MRSVILCMVVACSDRNAPPPKPAAGSDAAVGSSAGQLPSVKRYTAEVMTMEAPPIELPKQESFRLLDAGKGAKAPLRYAPLAGEVEHRAETKLVSRQLEQGVFGKPETVPPIVDGFHVQPLKGQLLVRPLAVEITGTASPLAEQYVKTWKTLLQDRRISLGLDPRGQLGATIFQDDPSSKRGTGGKDELVQRLLATVVPLPAEAVAPGARWEVVTILRQGPLYVKQTATYTLVARGKTWKLHVKLLRVGEEQIVVDLSLPKGVTAELLALFRLLEGDLEVDPEKPLVAAGSLTIESRIHARVTMQGQPPVEQLSEDTGTVTFSSR